MATGRRRGRAIIFIALILILLLVLGYVLYSRVASGTGTPNQAPAGSAPAATPTQASQATANLVVTTQDVRRGQELTDDLLAVVAVPREQYTENVFFKDKKDVVGARAMMDMKAHTPLTTSLIVAKGTSGSIPSFEIPAGKVAISIPVGKLSSVSYGIQKGDHVNVIVSLLVVDLDTNFQSRLPNRTGVVIAPGPIGGSGQAGGTTSVTAQLMSPPGYDVAAPGAASYLGRVEVDPTTNQPVFVIPSEAQRPRLVSQTLIQDVMVLQMGDFNQASKAAATVATPEVRPTQQQQQAQQQAAAAAIPDVVTLVVNPQDAVSLNYLMLGGASLNLVLRSAGDEALKDTEAATLQFILDQYRIPNPAKLPYGVEPRMNQFPSTIAPFPEPGGVKVPTPAPAQ